MIKIRDFVNQYATTAFTIILGFVVFFSFSCDTVDDENLNQLLQAEETTEATPSATTEADTQVPADEPIGLETLSFTINAMNQEVWAYFSFGNSSGQFW